MLLSNPSDLVDAFLNGRVKPAGDDKGTVNLPINSGLSADEVKSFAITNRRV